jgi:electron transfer flavoprotein beta subunit
LTVAGIGRYAPLIAACCKLVDLRVEVDPLSGTLSVPPQSSGMSPADEAALEWALRIAEGSGGSVLAVTAGPPAADQVLRDALAAGAARAVRVGLDRRATSAATAEGLAGVLGEAAVVCCGDASLDRGTGAVPAFLAGALGAEQALGLVGLHVHPSRAAHSLSLRAERRLDQGRREHLTVSPQCVLSVEAHTARLRRAPVEGILAARDAEVELVAARSTAASPAGAGTIWSAPVRVTAFRPRSRVVPAPDASLPARDRVLALTRSSATRSPARTLRLAPADAAAVLLESLGAWGELT